MDSALALYNNQVELKWRMRILTAGHRKRYYFSIGFGMQSIHRAISSYLRIHE